MVNVYNEKDELIKTISNPYARILLKDNKAKIYRKDKKFSIQLINKINKEIIMKTYKFKKNDVDIQLDIELKQDFVYFTTTIEKFNISIQDKLPFLYFEYMYKLSNKINMSAAEIESCLVNFHNQFYDNGILYNTYISSRIDVKFYDLNLINSAIKIIDQWNYVLSIQYETKNGLESNEHYINPYIVNDCYNDFIEEIKKSEIDYNKDYTVDVSKKFGKNYTKYIKVEKGETLSETEIKLNNEIEYLKCKDDIYYFINNYIKFEDGGILHEYQKEVLNSMLKSDVSTYYHSLYPLGKTTLLAIFSTYNLLFFPDKYLNSIFIAYEKKCNEFSDKMKNIIENLPDFLRNKIEVNSTYTMFKSECIFIQNTSIMRIIPEQKISTSKCGDHIDDLLKESNMILIDCCNIIRKNNIEIFKDDKKVIASDYVDVDNYMIKSPINIKDKYQAYTKKIKGNYLALFFPQYIDYQH